MTDGFDTVMAMTVVLRGLGAGFILGAELMTLPLRGRIDFALFATFMRESYGPSGVRIYAGLTIAGSLLTLALAIWTMYRGAVTTATWLIWLSLAATLLGFAGTAGAFPAMRELQRTTNDDFRDAKSQLDRFTLWGIISATGHGMAFALLVAALTLTISRNTIEI